jgi:hypothetical protein
LTQLISNVLSNYFYDTKVVQTLYPTSHKIKVMTYGFMSTSRYFESTFLCPIKILFHFLIALWVYYFFFLVYLTDTQSHHCTRYRTTLWRSLQQQLIHKWKYHVVVKIAQESQCPLAKEWCNKCLTCNRDQQARWYLAATKQDLKND